MNVYQRLNNARTAFHALKLEKTGHNKFAGYKYFELGDFLIPALNVFRENGLCAIVSFGNDIATLTIHDIENPAECIAITSPMGSAALKGCHEVQNIGAVETYQRRYLWVAALEIVEHDALDATTGKDSAKRGDTKPKTGGDSGSPTAILFHGLPADWQDYLRSLAVDVENTFESAGAGAAQAVIDAATDADDLDGTHLGALYSLLPSKTRSQMKALPRKEAA